MAKWNIIYSYGKSSISFIYLLIERDTSSFIVAFWSIVTLVFQGVKDVIPSSLLYSKEPSNSSLHLLRPSKDKELFFFFVMPKEVTQKPGEQ